jgi:hypothetical protein
MVPRMEPVFADAHSIDEGSHARAPGDDGWRRIRAFGERRRRYDVLLSKGSTSFPGVNRSIT